MNLMTEELKKIVPAFYETEDIALDDKIVYAKFFLLGSSWSWYIFEYDADTNCIFGLVDGIEQEIGYQSIDELEALRGPLGLFVERDLYFKPTKFVDLKL